MKRLFFLLIFHIPIILLAQCPQYFGCKDTVRMPDPYHHPMTTTYSPVCGCDLKTYRNCDAAYYWGGINQWDVNGPCENFDVDLYPNVISSDPSAGFGLLSIYMKNPGTATVLIYNSFGRLMYEHLFETSLSFSIMPSANPYKLQEPQTYPTGVYILTVIVNGDQKALKFIKVGAN